MSLLVHDGVLVPPNRFDLGGPGGGSTSGPGPEPPAATANPARFGLWLLLGTITMLFIGFTSALLVRRVSSDWIPMAPPAVLWANTAALLASSVTLELARRGLRLVRYATAVRFVAATGILGALFVAGQLRLWSALGAQGVYLSVNPHSDFFFVLTGVHVAHVLAALTWYLVVLVKLTRRAYAPGSDALGLFATFWHFLGVLWVYLLFALFIL
jgi:cytochrome c oxidase subunit III